MSVRANALPDSVPHNLSSLLVSLVRAGAAPDAPAHPHPPPPTIRADDWQALLPLARQHGLSGLLHHSLTVQPRADVPPAVQQTLRDAYLRTTVSQLLAYQALAELIELFGDASIPFIVLKGAALARTLYPDAALRPFGDLDLLVHETDHVRAGEILLTRGYQAIVEMSEGADSTLWGQQTFVRLGNQAARVELHWHLFVIPYYRRRARLEWFWNARETFDVDGRAADCFSPPAQFLHLAAHSALHHSTTRYIWLYDLALLLTRYGDTVAWESIGSAAQAFGLTRALKTALRETAALWQVPLPPQVQALFASAQPDPYERIVFALTRSPHKQARWLSDGASTDSAAYFLTHLFPSPAYMRSHYHIRHSALLPLYYGGRLGMGVLKFARALLTLPFGS